MNTDPGSKNDNTTYEGVLANIEADYKAKVAKVSLWGSNDYTVLFRETEGAVVEYLDAITKNPPSGSKPAEIAARLRNRRSALSLSSDITTEVVGVCKQILAFGAAGLGLSLGFADKIKPLAPGLQKALVIGGIFYLELVLISVIVLCLYLLHAHFRYPFLHFNHIGNTWPWFYYATISAEVPRSPVQLPSQVLQAGRLYARDLVEFASRVVKEGEQEELRIELQQYFILIAFQGYVNQFSLRMTNLFFYGMSGALLTLVVLAIWAVMK